MATHPQPPCPNLARALEFYDRWLPDTVRRGSHYTRECVAECILRHKT